MEEQRKKLLLNEDWLAFWLALLLFVVSLLNFADINVFGWIISVKEWTKLEKAISPVSAISGFASLLLTYLFLLAVMSVGAFLLGANVIRFAAGFTIVFWISFACWLLGHNAYIAATDAKKVGIGWSLKLTGEAGFIIALFVGLLIGNFFPKLSNFIREALKPEFYIKTAIGLMGAFLGIKSAQAFQLASAVLFRGLCAIIEAYLIYWALVYFIARRWFKFTREWSAPLASGISICGVSAAIATAGAIKARPVVPIMVSSLVVIFAVIELIILPFFAQQFLWREPMVAGAWMGLAVKTDGAAFASGAITDALIRAKAETELGIKYDSGWILMAASTTKLFIDIFISIWTFILAVIWTTKIESKPGEKVPTSEIWRRFPKFVLAYAISFTVMLLIAIPLTAKITPVENEIKKLEKQITSLEKKLREKPEAEKAQITEKIEEYRAKINELKNSISYEKNIQSAANNAASGTNALRVLFFLFTFFTIGVVSNFKNLWREGIGKLALVYFVCLFGFIIWIGLMISWIFFHGVKPPIISE
jgi:uncharacterized membrane protein YadS